MSIERKKINPALRFFVLLIGIYLFAYFFHQFYLLPDGRLDDFLNHVLGKVSYETLAFFGVASSLKIIPYVPISSYAVFLGNQAVVYIGYNCNGFMLYVLFTCFVLLIAGKWWQKGLFASIGIIAIFILNVARIIALLYVLAVRPDLFDINHHYVFSFIVYGFIFLMWRYWLNKHGFKFTKTTKSIKP
jgi:exosortase family protein XrtF